MVVLFISLIIIGQSYPHLLKFYFWLSALYFLLLTLYFLLSTQDMNIALIGYGKMGHTIEQVALKRSHNIVLRITSANTHEMDAEHLPSADVAIEFTRPDSARENVLKCISSGINVVSGTTGWNDRLNDAAVAAAEHHVAFLHASNFSIGVNIFFEVN